MTSHQTPRRKCPNCGRLFRHTRNKTCGPRCHKEQAIKVSTERAAKAAEKAAAKAANLVNDFLPADDEANVYGFWVPSPEEIEFETKMLNSCKRAGFVLEGSEGYK